MSQAHLAKFHPLLLQRHVLFVDLQGFTRILTYLCVRFQYSVACSKSNSFSIQHRQNTCKKNQRSTSACHFRIEVEMYSICVDLLEIPPSTLVSTCNNSDTSSRPIAKTSHCSNVEWNPAKWPRFSFGQGDS